MGAGASAETPKLYYVIYEQPLRSHSPALAGSDNNKKCVHSARLRIFIRVNESSSRKRNICNYYLQIFRHNLDEEEWKTEGSTC